MEEEDDEEDEQTFHARNDKKSMEEQNSFRPPSSSNFSNRSPTPTSNHPVTQSSRTGVSQTSAGKKPAYQMDESIGIFNNPTLEASSPNLNKGAPARPPPQVKIDAHIEERKALFLEDLKAQLAKHSMPKQAAEHAVKED